MADDEMFSRVASILNISKFFEEQKEAINIALERKNIYASLPTGYGKSMIYYAIPLAFDEINGQPRGTSIVVVISPLKSLMEDQVKYLQSLSLTAVALHEEIGDEIIQKVLRGSFTYIFASPEKMLSTNKWRDLMQSAELKNRLVAVVVDEAHCISQWGLPGSGSVSSIPFRSWYGNLGELKSIVPENTPYVVLTATASTATKKDIFKTLGLPKSTYCIEKNPEKDNIIYSVKYMEKNVPISTLFGPLLLEIREKKLLCDRTMVFCQTRKQCALLYSIFKQDLGSDFYATEEQKQTERVAEMYHAGTPRSVKKHIQENISKEDGHIRVLFCTVAFGMGVNIKGVHRIIHFGPSKNVESYVQECGRAGRDGKTSICLLLYNGLMAASCSDDIKEYCETTDSCRRTKIFKLFPGNFTKSVTGHECCDFCLSNCDCGSSNCEIRVAVNLNAEPCEHEEELEDIRFVNDEQRTLFQKCLESYRKQWMLSVSKTVVCLSILYEFSSHQIKQAVECCSKIRTLKDVERFVEVWRKAHAIAVLKAINDVFQDIDDNELDCSSESEHSDNDTFADEWLQIRDDSELNYISDSVLMDIDFDSSDNETLENESACSFIERVLGMSGNM